MFDVGASELLVIVVVAVVVIGPKDLPMAMRTAGRWVARIRRVSNHFRAGIETMIREAEMEEMERKWKEQNEAIMREHPPAVAPAEDPTHAIGAQTGGNATPPPSAGTPVEGSAGAPTHPPPHSPVQSEEPQLPLGGPPPPP